MAKKETICTDSRGYDHMQGSAYNHIVMRAHTHGSPVFCFFILASLALLLPLVLVLVCPKSTLVILHPQYDVYFFYLSVNIMMHISLRLYIVHAVFLCLIDFAWPF